MSTSIAVAGKGGTGKSTIAALIVQCLVEQGMGPVLAVDADPDANLGTLLGVDPEESVGEMREEVLRAMKNFPAGMSKPEYVQAGLHRVIQEAEGFDLITMGRGEGPGCYCSLNNLIRKFSDDLAPSYPWIVMDNEAGLEHISRRTTSNIDALVVVASDNPVALDTARRVDEITRGIKNKIYKKYIVTNLVKDQHKEEVAKRVSALPMEYLGDIPYDPALEEIFFQNGSLKSLGKSTAKDTVLAMIKEIGGTNGST